MLLERLQRPVRGVRIVRKGALEQNDAGCIQIIPTRPLTRVDVRKLLSHINASAEHVVTSALSAQERQVFLDAGFIERESLHLLRHDFSSAESKRSKSAAKPRLRLRTGRRTDINRVLEIDAQSFDDFWMLDREGLNAARKATPSHRYVVATIDQSVVGYAVTGRAGTSGFLQRLGVDPNHRRAGIGSDLVNDALAWARQTGARSMLVNTQESNERAVALYEHLGFTLVQEQLKVLEWSPNGHLSES